MLARVALGNVAGNVVDGGSKIVDSMFGEEELDASEQIVKLKAQLETIVKNKIDKEGHDRIVVFIDDLDRLVPEKAVELLEIMKLFLDIPKCVFILAVDYNVVITGLEKKFGSGVDDLKGKSFFDKIIQLPFNLPVANYDVNKYFKELLGSNFDYSDEDIDIFVRLANSSVGFNPRSMKRLFNSLQLLKMVAKSKNILNDDEIAKADEKQRILFGILCLQTSYEAMYRFMLRHQSNINQEFFDALKDVEGLKQSRYFDEICKDLGAKDEEDERLFRFLAFANNLFEAIQLKSDISEEADESLSDKELENFLRFLSFSSITTSNTSGISATSGTFVFKSYINDFLSKEVMPKFKDDLVKIGIEKIESFSNSSGWGCVYFNIKRFGLDFAFVIGTNNYDVINIALDDNAKNIHFKRFAKKWTEYNLKQDYPSCSYNGRATYGYLEFKSIKLDKNAPIEKRIELYKQSVISEIENFLPYIVKYYIATENLMTSYRAFLNDLLLWIKGEFSADDGWIVNSEETCNLGYSQTFITHKEWGEKPLSINLSADLNIAIDKFYFGIQRSGWNKSYLGESDLFNSLEQDFKSGYSDQMQIFRKYVDDKYSRLIFGNIYDFEEKSFIDENTQKELISYLCESLAKFKKYKDEIRKLSLQEQR